MNSPHCDSNHACVVWSLMFGIHCLCRGSIGSGVCRTDVCQFRILHNAKQEVCISGQNCMTMVVTENSQQSDVLLSMANENIIEPFLDTDICWHSTQMFSIFSDCIFQVMCDTIVSCFHLKPKAVSAYFFYSLPRTAGDQTSDQTVHFWLDHSISSLVTCRRKDDSHWLKRCIAYEEGARARGWPNKSLQEVFENDSNSYHWDKFETADRKKWKKLITCRQVSGVESGNSGWLVFWLIGIFDWSGAGSCGLSWSEDYRTCLFVCLLLLYLSLSLSLGDAFHCWAKAMSCFTMCSVVIVVIIFYYGLPYTIWQAIMLRCARGGRRHNSPKTQPRGMKLSKDKVLRRERGV